MDRRSLLAALSLAPFATTALAGGARTLNYTPGLVTQELAAGKTLLVDYAADWCSTCRRQEAILGQLRGANPAYNEAITFVRVDWDKYRRHEVTTSRRIPRRSTLVLLRGEAELGRLVAETRESRIRDLLDLGLTAA
ncbi:MAG: thioredoxin family protein [Pseudomonadota bacterium]